MDKEKLKKAIKPVIVAVVAGAALYFGIEFGPEATAAIGSIVDSVLGIEEALPVAE